MGNCCSSLSPEQRELEAQFQDAMETERDIIDMPRMASFAYKDPNLAIVNEPVNTLSASSVALCESGQPARQHGPTSHHAAETTTDFSADDTVAASSSTAPVVAETTPSSANNADQIVWGPPMDFSAKKPARPPRPSRENIVVAKHRTSLSNVPSSSSDFSHTHHRERARSYSNTYSISYKLSQPPNKPIPPITSDNDEDCETILEEINMQVADKETRTRDGKTNDLMKARNDNDDEGDVNDKNEDDRLVDGHDNGIPQENTVIPSTIQTAFPLRDEGETVVFNDIDQKEKVQAKNILGNIQREQEHISDSMVYQLSNEIETSAEHSPVPVSDCSPDKAAKVCNNEEEHGVNRDDNDEEEEHDEDNLGKNENYQTDSRETNDNFEEEDEDEEEREENEGDQPQTGINWSQIQAAATDSIAGLDDDAW